MRLEVVVPPLVSERLVWLRDAVSPELAVRVRVMIPVKLLRLVSVMVEAPDEGLTRTVCDVGFADIEKSDTLMVIVVEWTSVPLATLTVRV